MNARALHHPAETLKHVNMFQTSVLEKYSNKGRGMPSLVVFDLDYTLWPYYCECRQETETPQLYPQAMDILHALKAANVPMAIASRSPTPRTASTFLRKLGISDYFVTKEIYPSTLHKTQHFQAIQKSTGVPYNSMLFFDDEDRNIRAVRKLGVTSILVDDDGVCFRSMEKGLQDFSSTKQITDFFPK